MFLKIWLILHLSLFSFLCFMFYSVTLLLSFKIWNTSLFSFFFFFCLLLPTGSSSHFDNFLFFYFISHSICFWFRSFYWHISAQPKKKKEKKNEKRPELPCSLTRQKRRALASVRNLSWTPLTRTDSAAVKLKVRGLWSGEMGWGFH